MTQVLHWLSRLLGLGHQGNEESGGEKSAPTPWVTVLTAFDIIQPTLASARLTDAGIPSRIRQEAVSSVIPVNVGLLGRIEVQVPEPLAEEARQLVEALFEDAAAEDSHLFEDDADL
ncbi:MAG: hypothetical protein Kow00124_02610 [Anaerolineae bacterium]